MRDESLFVYGVIHAPEKVKNRCLPAKNFSNSFCRIHITLTRKIGLTKKHLQTSVSKLRRIRVVRNKDQTDAWSTLSLTAFADDVIKLYIPRIWDYFLDSLAFEGKSDQLRMAPFAPIPKECKRAVEVSAPHSDTVVIRVECNQRRHNRIEFFRSCNCLLYTSDAADD